MKARLALCASFLALALIPSARATTTGGLLANGGLEKDSTTALNQYNFATLSPAVNSSALPGWAITSGTVDVVPTSYWPSSEGSYSVDLIGTPGIGGIAQTVTTEATVGYTLTFDFSINPQSGPFHESTTTKILRVEARDSGNNLIAFQEFSDTPGTRTITDMQWTTKTFEFTAPDTSTTIKLFAVAPATLPDGATASTIYCGPVIDNLSLIAGGSPTPEPASLGILGVGASALLLKRRRGR